MSRILLIADGPAALPYCLPLLAEWKLKHHLVKVAPSESATLFMPSFSWSAFSGTPAQNLLELTESDLEWPEILVAAPVSPKMIEYLAGAPWLDTVRKREIPVVIAPALLPGDDQTEALNAFRKILPAEWQLLSVGSSPNTVRLGALGGLAIASQERLMLEVEIADHKHPLTGLNVMITAGPTIEDIDPVRFISNRSTGRMGLALARAALRFGANVRLVHGPIHDAIPATNDSRFQAFPVRSAQQMYEESLRQQGDCQLAILCAAVADYTPGPAAAHKIKKQDDGQGLKLELARTPDILASLGKLQPRPFLIGFAAESDDVEANAALKIQNKHCDIICANDITAPGCGFAVNTNQITMFFPDGSSKTLPLLSKDETAERIIQQFVERRNNA